MVLSKLLSWCQWNHFLTFWKTCVFHFAFGRSTRKNSALCREIFVGVAKTAFHVSQKHFEDKCLLAKNYVSFWKFLKISKFFRFSTNKLDRAVKTAFCLSIGPFLGKKILRKTFGIFIILGLRAIFLKLLSNISLRGFQSCFLCFHQNVSKKKHLFLKKIESFFNIFGYWVNKVWPSAIKISLDLSKLACTCPKVHSEAKKTFLKIVHFSKQNKLVPWTTRLHFFVNKISARLSKLQPMILLAFIEKKKLFLKNKIICLNLFWTLEEAIALFCQENYVGLSN